MKINDPIKTYYSHTPVLWRKIGDSLLIVSTSITAYGITTHQDEIALIALFTGTLGKVITNFFREDS